MARKLLWAIKASFPDQAADAPAYVLKVLAPDIREAVTIVENSRPEPIVVLEAVDFVYLPETEGE